MRGGGAAAAAAAWLAAALAGTPPLAAQISPGELSRPHAELEGSAHCLECHRAGEGVDADRCLDCHRPLAARISAGRGLHARPGHQSCERCHIEHHGREFELVWWGEAGRDAFDHALAGWELEGAHARLGCRDCHRPELIRDAAVLQAPGKDPARTFLGLDTACLSCHRDEHRGQVAAGSCLDCHDLEAWEPVPGFDHDDTRFPLTGLHRRLGCADCHATAADPDPELGDDSYLRFEVAGFERCQSCHRDPHEGRLGASCERCHSTAGWGAYDRSEFDHDRTRFPLRGRHRTVACESCHRTPGSFRAAGFDRCADCHVDVHLGQFAGRADGGRCDACHTEDGFTPSTFTLEEHQAGAYPLEGAHLAVACDACHVRLPATELSRRLGVDAALRRAAGVAEAIHFRLEASSCRSCHDDPHGGDVDAQVADGGCTTCHSLDGWSGIDFDHDLRTGFRLTGGHRDLACGACHPQAEEPAAPIRMSGASTACAACHRDPHLGQFAAPDGAVACDRCHRVDGWSAPLFDHDRDSRYPLEGNHREVPCAGCHPTESRDGWLFVRYRPLATECAACHADAAAERPRS